MGAAVNCFNGMSIWAHIWERLLHGSGCHSRVFWCVLIETHLSTTSTITLGVAMSHSQYSDLNRIKPSHSRAPMNAALPFGKQHIANIQHCDLIKPRCAFFFFHNIFSFSPLFFN